MRLFCCPYSSVLTASYAQGQHLPKVFDQVEVFSGSSFTRGHRTLAPQGSDDEQHYDIPNSRVRILCFVLFTCSNIGTPQNPPCCD